ncbi:9192_t:CDS:2, partial [Acaulospora colombiana]
MPKRKQVFNNRGDNEVFQDEWEDVVLAPKIELLQHVGINLDELPKNVYEFIKLSPHDIQLLDEKDGRAFLPPTRDPVSIVLSNSESFRVSSYTSYPIHNQYLAVAGYKSNINEHHPIGRKQKSDLNNAIQLWKVDCRIEDLTAEGCINPRLDM